MQGIFFPAFPLGRETIFTIHLIQEVWVCSSCYLCNQPRGNSHDAGPAQWVTGVEYTVWASSDLTSGITDLI